MIKLPRGIEMKFAIFVYLLATLAVTDAFQDEGFSCDRYWSVKERFQDCMESRGISDIGEMLDTTLDDGIVTRNEFIAKLTEICSNVEITDGLTFCMERMNTDCPELQSVIHDVIENKISFFCENGEPSSTILDALQNGFQFREGCERETLRQLIGSCEQEISNEAVNIINSQVNDSMSIFNRVVPVWFQCTLEGARENRSTELECGLTWRDILLRFWLFLSGRDYLAPTVPADQLGKIKNI